MASISTASAGFEEEISTRMPTTGASIWRRMNRKKTFDGNIMSTPLNRCLGTFDLTLLGIGQMAGSGIYVLTGTVVVNKTGPAIFIAYIIAGITAFLNAICYAELASRFPKAGSAYTYTYVAGGEFAAFIIGWSVILEYVLSASSVASGWSSTIDVLCNGAISNGTMAIMKFPDTPFLAPYPNFLAAGIILVLCLLLLSGPRLSVHFNTVITSINVTILCIIIVTMFIKAKPETFAEPSHGGFLPFSFLGVIAGTGTCFYAYIGFDGLACCVEEATNPRRSMPRAMGLSVGIVSALFVLSSLALVLFLPWYEVSPNAAFSAAFQTRGMTWARWVVGVGSLCGISASLFAGLYSLPRIVYAMADDGLIFKFFAYVLPSTKVPIWAILVFGSFAALLALILDIKALADFLSIGTLIAFSIVNMNVIVLRYNRLPVIVEESHSYERIGNGEESESRVGTLLPRFRQLPLLRSLDPGVAVKIALLTYVVSSTAVAALLLLGSNYLVAAAWWIIVLLVVFLPMAFFSVFVMAVHEQDQSFDSYQVPGVPFIPCICIFLNLCLIVKLSGLTWARYAIWLVIGFIIYFAYGYRHSNLRTRDDETRPLFTATSREDLAVSQEIKKE